MKRILCWTTFLILSLGVGQARAAVEASGGAGPSVMTDHEGNANGFNITITALSVAVALIIGTIELLGLLADQLGWSGGFWDWISGLNLNLVGYLIVGLFILTWVIALLTWRYARIEEKWTTTIRRTESGEP